MVAARLGFEPRYPAPEAGVLPLDDLAIANNREIVADFLIFALWIYNLE